MWYNIIPQPGRTYVGIYSDIGVDRSADEFLAELGPTPNIELVFQSSGGCCVQAFKVYEALRHRNVTATIHRCYSAATVIAQAARETKMADDGSIMIHSPTTAVFGTPEQLEESAKELRELRERMARLYSDRTEKPLAAVLRWLSKDTFFNAKEAWAAGLVDEIFALPSEAPVCLPAATGGSFRTYDDGKADLALEMLHALGAIRTSDRKKLYRNLSAWFGNNVRQTNVKELAGA